MDKDSDPVKHFEGANYRIIINRHKSFPMPINEDGTIRLPTLEETEQMCANDQVIKQDLCSPESLAEQFRAIEEMRAAGQVREDLSPILGGAVDREMDMPPAELAPNPPVENNSAK